MNEFKLIKHNYPYYWYKKGESNNKPPIIYIHGFSDHPRWLFNTFNKINNHDIYCIELPGHWETPLRNKKQLRPINYAREIILLIKSLKIEKFYLMGHSMGGGISMMINLLEPSMIEKIILIAPMNSHCAGIKEIYSYLFRYKAKKNSKLFYKLLVSKKNIDKLWKNTNTQLKKNFKKRWLNYKILSLNLGSISNLFFLKKAEKNLDKKTLLMLGNKDKVINFKKSFKYFSKNKNVEIKVFNDCGHMIFYEDNELFSELVYNFIL